MLLELVLGVCVWKQAIVGRRNTRAVKRQYRCDVGSDETSRAVCGVCASGSMVVVGP